MKIKCDHCQTSFVLPQDRIPEVSKFKLNCPKCREPIIIDQDAPQETIVGPEHFPHNAVVAFIFVQDQSLNTNIENFFRDKDIYISQAQNITQALEKLRINYYDLLILEDGETVRPIMDLVKKWDGLRRREVNIIVVHSAGPSLQEQEAFLRGVNAVISRDDAPQITKFLNLALDNYNYGLEPWLLAEKKLQAQV